MKTDMKSCEYSGNLGLNVSVLYFKFYLLIHFLVDMVKAMEMVGKVSR